MPVSSSDPVLRRKIAAHARPAPELPDGAAEAATGFTRALRHAAAPFEGLGLEAGAALARREAGLSAALAALPEAGLLAVLEAEGGARGLVTLSPGMIDALVEVQTTGRVDAGELPPREVTRIDEALVREFLDFTLAAFAQETAELPGRDWPARLVYGSRVRDRGQVSLLLPEGRYLVLMSDLGFEGVARRASVVLLLPPEGAGAMPGSSAAATGPAPAPAPADADWCRARQGMIDRMPLPLEAVLMRVTRPLAEVDRLAVGDLIPFGAGELAHVTLETGAGATVLSGRLGQMGGRRALRLPGAAAPRPDGGTGPPRDAEPGLPAASG